MWWLEMLPRKKDFWVRYPPAESFSIRAYHANYFCVGHSGNEYKIVIAWTAIVQTPILQNAIEKKVSGFVVCRRTKC